LLKKLKKIRVLVVDDSFFMRNLVTDLLSKDRQVEVVGTAKNGVEAVGEAVRLKPDVITMDFNMPRMNGAQAVAEILSNCQKKLPGVVMFSAYTTAGAEATLESLRAGAVDFVAKPSGELSLDIDKVEDELLSKVHAAARAVVRPRSPSQIPKSSKHPEPPNGPAERLVVIGASTGGPPIVEDILMDLPVNFPGAVLVVQHMPEYFIKKFSKRLNKLTPFTIKEATDGEMIDKGDILIAPGNRFIDISRQAKSKQREIKLVSNNQDQRGLTSIDRAMTSAAKSYGADTIGVVLTGMGEDGLLGMKAIEKAGGYTIAQDPASAVVASMPVSVIKERLAQETLAPRGIAARIIELCEKE